MFMLKSYKSSITTINTKTSHGRCRAVDLSRKSQFRVILDGIRYPNIVPLYQNTSIDFDCLASSNTTKTILMWTKFKGLPFIDYGFGVGEPFKRMNCPVTNCELTDDRRKLKDADFVLFHLRNKIDYIPGNFSKKILSNFPSCRIKILS